MTHPSSSGPFDPVDDDIDDDIVIEFDEAPAAPISMRTETPFDLDAELFSAIEGAVERITGEHRAVGSDGWREIGLPTRSPSGAHAVVDPPVDQMTIQLDADDLMSVSGLGENEPTAAPIPPPPPENASSRRATATTPLHGVASASGPIRLPEYAEEVARSESRSAETPPQSPAATVERRPNRTLQFSPQEFEAPEPLPPEEPVVEEREPAPTVSLDRSDDAERHEPIEELDGMLASYFGSAPSSAPPAANASQAEHRLRSSSAPPVEPVVGETGPMPVVDSKARIERPLSHELLAEHFPSAAPPDPPVRERAASLSAEDTLVEAPNTSELLEEHFGDIETVPLDGTFGPAPDPKQLDPAAGAIPISSPHDTDPFAEIKPAPAIEETPDPEDLAALDAAALDTLPPGGARTEDSSVGASTEALLRAYVTGSELTTANEKPATPRRVDTEELLAAYLSDPLAMPQIAEDANQPPVRRRPAPRKPKGRALRGNIVERTSGLSTSGEARRVGDYRTMRERREEFTTGTSSSDLHTPIAADESNALASDVTARPTSVSGGPAPSRQPAVSAEIWTAPNPGPTRGTTPISPAYTAGSTREFSAPGIPTRPPVSLSEDRHAIPRLAPNSEDRDTIQIDDQQAIDALHEYLEAQKSGQLDHSQTLGPTDADELAGGGALIPGRAAQRDQLPTREVQLSSDVAADVLARYIESVSQSGSHRAAVADEGDEDR